MWDEEQQSKCNYFYFNTLSYYNCLSYSLTSNFFFKCFFFNSWSHLGLRSVGRSMMLKATFNNSSVKSWQLVLLVEETRVFRENHRPVTSHWQTLSYNAKFLYDKYNLYEGESFYFSYPVNQKFRLAVECKSWVERVTIR